jgi:hypothetical protein
MRSNAGCRHDAPEIAASQADDTGTDANAHAERTQPCPKAGGGSAPDAFQPLALSGKTLYGQV